MAQATHLLVESFEVSDSVQLGTHGDLHVGVAPETLNW